VIGHGLRRTLLNPLPHQGTRSTRRWTRDAIECLLALPAEESVCNGSLEMDVTFPEYS
jgi:hypothetical protein